MNGEDDLLRNSPFCRRRSCGLFFCSLLIVVCTQLFADGGARVLQDARTAASVDSTLARAGAAMRAGNAAEGVGVLTSWLEVHPADAEALMALGSLYDQMGQPEKAEPLLGRAAKINRNATLASLKWATVLTRLHRYADAERALAGVPTPKALDQRIAYLRLKASVEAGTGNADAAATQMELALKLAPDDKSLILATGIAESHAGHGKLAIYYLGPLFATGHDPRTGLALLEAQVATHQAFRPTLAALRTARLIPEQELPFRVQLGEVLSRAGLHAEALREFGAAVAQAPERADLRFDFALAQFRAGQLDAALATALSAKARENNAEVEQLIGDIQEKRGENLAAVQSYQAAITLSPGDEQYRMALGLELLQHQTFEPALAVFQQAAGLPPRPARAYVALGLTYFFLERYSEAIGALLQATHLDPNSQFAFDYLGEIELQQPGSPDSTALDALCQYADAHPSRGKVAAYCGALLLRLAHDRGGNLTHSAEIIRRLREAVRLAPNDAMAHCQFGKALDWIEHWQEARPQMENCARLEPDSAEAHYRLARIYQRLGQRELSRKEMELQKAASRQLVQANARRDATLKKFLYSMKGNSSP